ncbi:MAG: transketolase [Desulfarculus sp.]|nr:transketolase [Pseudomonadota bacterium]MBV1715718.1 transketolase [Desulfarculus sp.]MBU4575733.1 transketolase [Pseudomonadota bacterium]MBU4597255.1 transketolase [Pseudomonadota bacterium]MBV1739051.1 transketolase [Desulfarculus sp.]
MSDKDMEQLAVNTIRMLAADMVEQANSGHPGMPLGAAPMAYLLWTRFMHYNPSDPQWANRDRFVLSAGHGSALLYAMLHLTGYDLSLEDLKNFRQWGSKTPGHPEYGVAPGVEATTGPLGQGFGMGVGMALAERFLAQTYNRPSLNVIDHYTYAIVSDGDLMEGVASEAASLAATLGLGKLIYLYDDNHISIEGGTELTFTEDAMARFEAYGWHTQKVADGNDLEAMARAVEAAKAETGKPSIIAVRTHIGYGSPKVDTSGVHGEPLGAEALETTRKTLGCSPDSFCIPQEALKFFRAGQKRGMEQQEAWQKTFARYSKEYPELAARLQDELAGVLPSGWDSEVPEFAAGEKIATRAASGKVLNALALKVPNLVGGSADLAPSTKTLIAGSGDMRANQEPGGRNIHFGVRELGMGAVVNGMALHGGVIPYGATFFVFSDYMRPALRLSAIMGCHSIWIFTHDSIGVGEDGPTHQPVEQLMSLRLMPGFTVLRPAEGNETAAAWRVAMKHKHGPVALILTRQKLPCLDPEAHPIAKGVAKGAYVLKDCDGAPELILMATGSEVTLALAAAEKLASKGLLVRAVSMPSWEIFEAQDKEYRDKVLPPKVTARLAIEAGVSLGWERWVGSQGAVIGVDRFGESAPGPLVMDKLGFNLDNVVDTALELIKK